MGGAVAVNLSLMAGAGAALGRRLTGVVLASPMVKISDQLKPSDLTVAALRYLAAYFPYAPVTPIEDIVNHCIKRPDVLLRERNCPLGYSKVSFFRLQY